MSGKKRKEEGNILVSKGDYSNIDKEANGGEKNE
jgi:hypothetical protein